MELKIKTGDYILFRDSFKQNHIGIITKVSEKNEFHVVVKYTSGISMLNTVRITNANIDYIFDKKPNFKTIEYDYPDFFI